MDAITIYLQHEYVYSIFICIEHFGKIANLISYETECVVVALMYFSLECFASANVVDEFRLKTNRRLSYHSRTKVLH